MLDLGRIQEARSEDLMVKNQPFFSIVVPTYQRPVQLTACLQALGGLDYARESFEVIVVEEECPKADACSRAAHFTDSSCDRVLVRDSQPNLSPKWGRRRFGLGSGRRSST